MGMGGNVTDGRGFGRIMSCWDQTRSHLCAWSARTRNSSKYRQQFVEKLEVKVKEV